MIELNTIKPYTLTSKDETLIQLVINEMEQSLNGGIKVKGYEDLVEWDRGDGSNTIAHFSFVNDEGEIHHSRGQACHWDLRSPTIANVKFIINRIMEDGPRGVSAEVKARYIDYLVNRSPYSYAFVRKDAGENILAFGYWVCRTDVPANLVGGACTAMRMLQEHKASVPCIWNGLVERGVPEDLAYCYAFQVMTLDHEHVSSEAKYEWHSSWDGQLFSQEMASNYIHHVMPNDAWAYDEQCQEKNANVSYTPMCNAWGWTDRRSYLQEHVEELMEKGKALGAKEKPPTNPFAAGRPPRFDCKLGNFLDLWAPFLMEKWADVFKEERKAA